MYFRERGEGTKNKLFAYARKRRCLAAPATAMCCGVIPGSLGSSAFGSTRFAAGLLGRQIG